MANIFDQFDAPATAAPQGNVFDQFDAQRVDPFNETPMPAPKPVAPAAAPPNGLLDVAQALPSGMIRGAVETAMLPVTAGRLVQSGGDFLHGWGEDRLRELFGGQARQPDEIAALDQYKSEHPSLNDAIFGGQDMVRSIMGDVLYDPQTTGGEYAATIGEFLAPGGLPSKAARMAPSAARMAGEYAADVTRNAVLPAVASEAAGQFTEGTDAELWARTAGAFLGGGAGAVGKAAYAPESVLRRAVGNPDDIDWARAVGLQENGTGVRLSGPEAIAQAQGGASALPDVMRVVEGSVEGNARMAPFFAQRPDQVSTAVNTTLDAIAPQSAQPYSLGPRVSTAANDALDTVRQDINTSTRPLYQAAEPQPLPQAEFDTLTADPRFASALARLRASELGPDYAAFPDNSVAVVDAVTKDMFARGEALGNAANPLYGPELGAANTAGAANARNAASANSPEYAQALAEQAAARQNTLAPLENGPLGQAAAANTTQSVGDAILPRNPLVGSEGEISDAVTRLVMQDADATSGLVRQNLADRFSAASTDTQQGVNQFAGARFAKDISGNPQRDATLYSVLDALGATDAAAQFPELLDVLQATGRRKPIGSATEFNRTINADLGNASPTARAIDLARSLGASWLTNAGDATKRAALRNSTATLADMFTDPNSVELIRAAMAKGVDTNLVEALLRASAQSAPILNDE